MTHGLCMEIPLEFGLAGIGIRGFSLMVLELHLASASESAGLADLTGDGDIGATIGITTGSSSITAPTFRTAEFSPIAATSIAPADFMVADSTAAISQAGERSAGRTDSPVHIPERSVDSIGEEWSEDFLLAGSRALVEVSMVVEASTAAVVEGDSV